MERTWRFGIIVAGMVITAVCLGATAGAAPKPAPPAKAKQAPVVGHLLLRKYRVTFKVGDRFTVHTRDGKQVAADVTLAQLKSIDLGLYEALQPIEAGDAFVYAGK